MTIAEQDNLLNEDGEALSTEDLVSEVENIDEAIEAVLFAAGHPMTYAQLAKPFEISPGLMKERVYMYAQQYNNSPYPRGVILLTFDESCQLCTKQEYLQHIRVALGIRRSGSLSTSCIEALAIIAYSQPTTRAYVDNVRGVDSTYAMTTLVERGLIEAKGRLDAPGRPMLYGTTSGFLRCFGLSSLDELPGITSEEAYEVLSKMSRELEGQITLDESLKEAMPAEATTDDEASLSESSTEENEVSIDNYSAEETDE